MQLVLNKESCYLNQYTVSVKEKEQKSQALVTMSPLPFIPHLNPSTAFSISFIPDSVRMSRHGSYVDDSELSLFKSWDSKKKKPFQSDCTKYSRYFH